MAEEAIFINYKDTNTLKKAIAKSMYAKKIDQIKISEILDISQPMVSNYLSSKEKVPNNILKLAEKITEKNLNDKPLKFYTCITFDDKPIQGNLFIADKNEIINEEINKIVDNLTQAFLILKEKDFTGLIPQVKINIAMAKNDAKSTDDVASFLNGLIIADDKVISNNGIRFGKSKHLSSLLIGLNKSLDAKAIMNIAYLNKIKKTNLNFDYLTNDFKLSSRKKNIDVLLHKGDFGIEPCAYIIGKDAVDVANKILKIRDELK